MDRLGRSGLESRGSAPTPLRQLRLARVPDEAAASTVTAALEEGITLFDTADSYGRGRSEELLGAALRGRRERGLSSSTSPSADWPHSPR